MRSISVIGRTDWTYFRMCILERAKMFVLTNKMKEINVYKDKWRQVVNTMANTEILNSCVSLV